MADGAVSVSAERAGLVLPFIPELEKLPARIDAEDEREIRSFFENPSVATITQSSGAFGGQLERAECFGYGALPCQRCGGRWLRVEQRLNPVTGELEEVVIGWRDGTGRRPKQRIGKGGKRETYAAALARYRVQQRLELKIVISAYPRPSAESGFDAAALWDATVESYWARGEALMTASDFREAFPTLPDDWTEPCTPCEGLGVVPRRNPGEHAEVTAWPKGSSVGGRGRENLDADALVGELDAGGDFHDGNALIRVDALSRWLGVAEVLRDVETLSPVAREGLERFYAPRESRASWGRLGLIELAGSASKVGELQDHLSQCWNFCAYGAAS